MKIFTWILSGAAGIFIIARLVGWCPAGSCSASHGATAAIFPTPAPAIASLTPGFEPLTQAFTDAKVQHKLVLVDVYTDWCHWCKQLDKDVYPDRNVQKQLHAYFAATKVNAESDASIDFLGTTTSGRQLAPHWSVTGYPTILFLSPDGNVIERVPGYLPAKDFASLLEYIGTGAYRTTSFDDWQTKRS